LLQRVPEQHCLMKEHENRELDRIVMAEEKLVFRTSGSR